jgi:hypothetical protein
MRRFVLLVGVLVCCFGAPPALAAGPTAIGVDSAGVVYVGFANGGMIKRYAGSDGSPLAPWGTPGNAPGQLGGVVAIDVAPGSSGNVWILDTNRRVQEFTRAGQYVRGIQLGTCSGSITPNPLQRGGLDVSNDSVYVAHPCDNSLLRLRSSDLQIQATASPTAVKGVSAQLYSSAPSNTVALYAAQPSLNQVSILQPQYFSQLGTKSTPGPSDVFVDAFGVLFTSDIINNVLHLYGSDGNEFRTLGRPGSNAGDLNNPTAFDVFEQFSDLAGNIFIADYGNNRIQRWSSGGFTFWTAPADDSTSGPGGQPPVNTVAPQIQGTPTQGQSVTCTQGTWTNSPTGYSYVWQRNGSPIGGATSSSYTIQAADVGQNLTCVVTASNAAGSGQASSAAVVPVASVQAPVNQTRPQISGTPAVGNVLTCSQGTWTNSPTGYSYAWIRNASTTVGSASSYTVQAADAGQVLTCSVTASNAAGATTAVSDPVTVSNPGCTGGTTGVSIDNGATFTTSPGVILTIHEPAGATGVVISNDGGFASPTTSAIACGDSYSWTLTTTPTGRSSKTVYVRFTGPGIDGDKTFSDDIVLDSAAPLMKSATLSNAKSPYVLRLSASDRGSGVARVQLASSKSAKRVRSYAYRSKLSVRYKATARFARAIDRAGNVGRWRAVRTLKR